MKKLKPQEMKHLKPKAAPRCKKPPCPSFDILVKDAEASLKYGTSFNYRSYYALYYKNGANEFDRALAFLNSPLMKALS